MKTRATLLRIVSACVFLVLPRIAFADTEPADTARTETTTENPVFGPFEAIELDPAYIVGVKVDEAGKIWLKLRPEVKEREMQLKISNLKDASYRNWFTGSPVLVSPANQNKKADAWTDWITSESNYIEYWMDGKRILHLKRIKR